MTTIDPFTREFDRIVRRALSPSVTLSQSAFAQALPMDTLRRDGEVVLRFDVPGVEPEKIDVTVDHGMLTVSATREESVTEGDKQIVRERFTGTYTRSIRLSDHLDVSAIEATHKDGVLELHIPVREEAKPRKITVNSHKELSA
jgi:HSP20 family protein